MKVDVDLSDVVPKASSLVPAEAQIASGIPIPPIKVLRVMSPGDWEDFTEEWLSYHKNEDTYHSIKRYSGPRDLGLDVVAFTSESGFDRPWDSYNASTMITRCIPETCTERLAKSSIIHFREHLLSTRHAESHDGMFLFLRLALAFRSDGC